MNQIAASQLPSKHGYSFYSIGLHNTPDRPVTTLTYISATCYRLVGLSGNSGKLKVVSSSPTDKLWLWG